MTYGYNSDFINWHWKIKFGIKNKVSSEKGNNDIVEKSCIGIKEKY